VQKYAKKAGWTSRNPNQETGFDDSNDNDEEEGQRLEQNINKNGTLKVLK